MDKITTTIKRVWLREIAADRKRVEYRENKAVLDSPTLPRAHSILALRLINGMHAKAPEITVVVRHVCKNSRLGRFELVLSRIVEVKYWSLKLELPAKPS